MKKSNNISFNFFLLFFSFFFILGCNNPDGENFIDDPESPVGEYKCVIFTKYRIISPGTAEQIEFTGIGCDTFSTIKFNNDNTFEFIDRNSSEDEDCTNEQIISGNWVKTNSIAGGFTGDLSFIDTFRGYTILNGTYSSAGINNFDGDANIVFETSEEDQNYSYGFYFQEI